MDHFLKKSRITWRKGKSYLNRLLMARILEHSPNASQLMFDEGRTMSKSLTVIKQIDQGYFSSIPHPRDQYLESHGFSSRFLVRATNISADSKTGIITLESGEFIPESSSWSRQDLILNVVHRSQNLGPKRISSSESLLLPSNGFYHWLIEDLPLYLRLQKDKKEKNQIFNTYVYEFAPSYVRDFLNFSKVEGIDIPRFADFNEMYFISRGDDTGWPRIEDVQILRETFLPLKPQQESSNKIYVSRLKSTRSTSYEVELIKLLAARGWKILYLETLPFMEQIQTLSQAEVLCGLHGAGLAGMVWMEDSAKVIEISRETMARACFARLASVCGLNYFWLSDSSMDAKGIYDSILELSD